MGMGSPETARRGLMTPMNDAAPPASAGGGRLRHRRASMTLTSTLVVILGGAIGTFLRYFISVLALPISRELPWGTIIINITGSFVIGLFGTLTLASGRYPVPENLRLFVMIGICGG